MGTNLCTPAAIYGGSFQQHIFLGLSVSSFSSSIGWNGQIGELTVNLVYDPCSSKPGESKIYYDENLNAQTTTGPDPGFTFPTVGSPAYFRFGNEFEYSGLIQSYEEQATEGGDVWVVKLVDPTEIIRGTQLILGDYAGSVNNVHNILNIYGFCEAYGPSVACPLTTVNGAQFGSPAGAFGGALLNNNGMPWSSIYGALELMTSSLPLVSSVYAPYGRLVFRGSSINTDGYGVMRADVFDPAFPITYPGSNGYLNYYYIDLSSLPIPPSYYRIAGTSASLLDVISQLCDDAGFDFYIELVPVRFGGDILKIIKIRTAYRRTQPTLGQISSFLDSANGANQQSVGQELRNEVTSAILIGGQVESIYQADNVDYIEQFWGLNDAGDVIETEEDLDDNTKFRFAASTTNLNNALFSPLGVDTIYIYEDELRAALAGQDVWEAWSASIGSTKAESIGATINARFNALLDISKIAKFLKSVFDTEIEPLASDFFREFRRGDGDPERVREDTFHDLNVLYDFVNNFASNYFGKKFSVRLPYTCAKIEPESTNIIYSEEVADSGWTEYPTILGLPHPTIYTDFFGEENGKIAPFVGFVVNEEIDFSHIDPQDVGFIGNRLYVRAEPDTNLGIVFLDKDTLFSPRAVVTIPDKIFTLGTATDIADHAKAFAVLMSAILTNGTAFGLAADDATATEENCASVLEPAFNRVGGKLMNFGFPNKLVYPNAAAIAIKSNVLTYGPWYVIGPPGQTKVDYDTGLVPWEYGSAATLALAGLAEVQQGLTYMQTGETGSVTIPGLPSLPLGAELRHGAPGILENRLIVTNDSSIITGKVFLTLNEPAWTGLDGPNITTINCEIGQNGILTTYQMRTYTPKYGRFSRQNAERLKKFGVLNLQMTKAARLTQFNLFNKVRNIAVGNFINNKKKMELRGLERGGHSPSGIMIGQQNLGEVAAIKRNEVSIAKYTDLSSEFTEDFEKKAMMSLDGLFRPVSKTASDLPSYVTSATGAPVSYISRQIEPPIENVTYTNIYTRKLDPTMDIDDTKDYRGGDTHHDIELIARGTEPPEDSMKQKVRGEQQGDPSEPYTANNYRFMALKGPMVYHAWGYDLDGKPVPNESDIGDGTFSSSGLTNYFKANWLEKPETWPVAPFDWRFDRERGCWTIPSGFRMVRARLSADISKATGWKAAAVILKDDGRAIEDPEGTAVEEKQITVYCPFIDSTSPTADEAKMPGGIYAKSGDIVVAYFDSNSPSTSGKGKYWALIAPKTVKDTIRWGLVKSEVTKYDVDAYQVTVWPLPSFSSFPTEADDNEPITVLLPIRYERYSVPLLQYEAYIAYAPVADSVSPKYVCVSDYDETQLVFYATAGEDSLPTGGSCPDFQAMVEIFLDAGVSYQFSVTVKNRMNHPILNGQKLYLYRHLQTLKQTYPNATASDAASEWWLLRAEHCPVCLLSNIKITEDADMLKINIFDRDIYLDTAWTGEGKGEGYIYSDPITDRICVSSSNNCVNLDLTPVLKLSTALIKSTCGTSDTGSGGGGGEDKRKFKHCDREGQL